MPGIINSRQWLKERRRALEAELDKELPDDQRQAVEAELDRVRAEADRTRRGWWRRWIFWGAGSWTS